ncbi:hypothetical protein H6P81_009439 [Aristolochia fimbriata]|uniref:Zinc finger PHD-type domain-containing protein n=1 Tax=Aristolochia fimbriata TaxID=158543 RepID=A0AAV7EL55_ARIFI|nr:hypothetical protein H6P81_009439 [Aristolochia fimbriata]
MPLAFPYYKPTVRRSVTYKLGIDASDLDEVVNGSGGMVGDAAEDVKVPPAVLDYEPREELGHELGFVLALIPFGISPLGLKSGVRWNRVLELANTALILVYLRIFTIQELGILCALSKLFRLFASGLNGHSTKHEKLGDLRGGRKSAAFQRHKEEEVYSICGVPCYAELMVLCDDCNQVSEHIYCMRNHLDEVPDIWFCEACQVRRDSDSYCPTTSSNMNENSSDKSDAAASFQ